ncbi:NrdH-redoxin [Candidatus Saccharibacteria bacterium]|nr:NrdH-redoxin [Candidatus Saccharibacteria bacterium]MCB9834420.1 NrdH-redoxin [Candidatus Nomurabacteria bacterium]
MKVTIYSTKTCPYCHLAKDYLNSKKVDFEEVLLDDHPGKAQEAIKTCNSLGVPCIKVEQDDGSVVGILGFDKPKLDIALGLS